MFVLSVSLLETYFGRMTEATEMPFGVVGWTGSRKKHVGLLNGVRKGAILEKHK